ncbi:MAG: hypothetical protein EBU18_11845 [Rhodobacteraceae bacterium]|nr:hypothetical protein [Paracoccaceae bacterium]
MGIHGPKPELSESVGDPIHIFRAKFRYCAPENEVFCKTRQIFGKSWHSIDFALFGYMWIK